MIGLCSSLFDFNSNSIKVERLGELRCIVSSKQGYTNSALETTCFSSDNAKLNMISFTEAESVRYQHIKSDVIFVVQKTSVSRLFRKARVSYLANLIKTKTIDSSLVYFRRKNTIFLLDQQNNKLMVNKKVLKNQVFLTSEP